MIPPINPCHPFRAILRGRRPAASSIVPLRTVLRGDRGSASVEVALATAALLFMLLGIVQFALWSHATHVAQAAASHGLAAARVQQGTAADGTAAAQRVLDRLGDGPLTNTQVDANRDTDAASVRVTGEASTVVPFLRLPVHAGAAGPVERFVPDPLGFVSGG